MTFITFEGCDGSGKTSQVKMLHDFFVNQGIPSVTTKEPGGTVLAEKLRQILLQQEIEDPATEFALLTAARRDHMINFIKPHLEKGTVVISDRFFDSSIAYQGLVKGLEIDKMIRIHNDLVGSLEPNITFLLDIDPGISLKRLGDNGRILNHYDSQSIDFYSRIREAFLQIAKRFPDRIVILDANRSIEDIALEIRNYIAKLVRH